MSFREWLVDRVSDTDDSKSDERLEEIEAWLDELTKTVDQINSQVSKLTPQNQSEPDSINEEHESLNQDVSQEKGREDYRNPILVSLYELGKDEYWESEEIQDNWRGKYLELNEEDLAEEEAGLGKRQVYKNRHAWALVDLQRDNLIKKNGDKKEYQITDKGLQHLKEEALLENWPSRKSPLWVILKNFDTISLVGVVILEQLITGEDAKEIYKDFEEVSVPISREVFDDPPEREKRFEQKVSDMKKEYRRRRNRADTAKGYIDDLTTLGILQTGQTLIGISIYVLLYILIKAVYLSSRASLKLVDVVKISDKSSDKWNESFRQSWNNSMKQPKFLAGIVLANFFRSSMPKYYFNSVDTWEEVLPEIIEKGEVPWTKVFLLAGSKNTSD